MINRRWCTRAVATTVVVGMALSLTTVASGRVVPAYGAVSSPDDGSGHNILQAASETTGTSGPMAFAVGEYDVGGSSLTSMRTLALEWSGSSWTLMSTPNADNESNEFLGVAALSPTEVFAVGTYYVGAAYHNLAEVWNGEEWRVMAPPTLGTHDNELDAVAAYSPSNVWAVGYYLDGSVDRQQSLIEHYNGSSWQVVPSPNMGTDPTFLSAISIVPGTDGTQAWSVGWCEDLSDGKVVEEHTVIEHLSGGVWTMVKSANEGAQTNQLDGVAAASGSSAYAVGSYTSTSTAPSKTLVEAWNGSSWRVVKSANTGSSDNALNGVVEANSKSVFAFGHYTATSGHYQTLAERLRLGSFAVVSSANESTNRNELLGAAVAPNEPVWAVGTFRNGTYFRTLVEKCAAC
jgi:hypothetical protein